MLVLNRTRGTTLATSLEVADSGPKRNKGLLGRKALEPGSIPLDHSLRVGSYLLHATIDLVYIDRKNIVRKVCESVPAWRISICLSAHSILELPAGTIRGFANAAR